MEKGMEVERLGDIAVIIRDENRTPAAFGGIFLNNGEIVGLYVAPEHRGKFLERRIVESLLEIAKEHGLHEISATVNLENKVANVLLERAGLTRWNKWIKRLDSNPSVSDKEGE